MNVGKNLLLTAGVCLILAALAACGVPVPPAAALTAVPSSVAGGSATPAPSALGSVAATAVTSASSTPVPASPTPVAPGAGGAAPSATPAAGALTPTDLKYRLIDQFGELFYCDPDFYPVARGDQAEMAARTVPTIKQNEPEKYLGIVKHLGLGPATVLDNAQTAAVYLESKRLNAIFLTSNGESYKFALRIRDAAGKGNTGWAIEGVISGRGDVTVTQKNPASLQCPICLASDAQIDTPLGPVPVSGLRVGMPVWTSDEKGNRVIGFVEQAAQVAVLATHQVVRLRLEDGRELRVSPGHPTADGRRVGDLAAGDTLDGSRVVSVAREAYADGATYDLLPSGGTGFYWANGILLGSTLR